MVNDAPSVAPHLYKVIIENARVRVLEVQGKPGDKAAMHSHPATVVVAVTDGQLRFTVPGGEVIDSELKAGQAMYMDSIEHTVEIVGPADVRALIVELK